MNRLPRVARVRRDGLAAAAVADETPRAAILHGLILPAAPLALTTAGIVVWALALPGVEPSRMSDAGLVSVLPTRVFVALALVSAGFLATMHLRPVGTVLLIHLVALVAILFGTTSVVEHVPHISATWRHVGIIDYIGRTHRVDPNIDAYFNWPGFFIFSAFMADVAGAGSTIGFARWAPALYEILYLLPIFLIARAGAADRRLVWTTVWLFTISNWVAQDYFSPQATTYLLYLVGIALLLSWFSPLSAAPVVATGGVATTQGLLAWARRARGAPPAPRGTATQRILLLLALIVVVAATVPSHQLTPFAVLAATTGLVAIRACTARGLPLLVFVMIAAWVSFMAVTYLAGHFGAVVGGLGKVDQNVSSNLGGRLHGSPDHMVIVLTRIGVTGGLWLLALIGLLRRFRNGYRDQALAVLAAAPFFLIGLQSYGGEILLRIYLFALPFMAFFAAAAFFTSRETRSSWRATGALAVVSALLVAGFLVSRYGNERADFFTKGEVGAFAYVNRVAPKRARLVSLSRDYPRAFARYGDFRYVFVSELPPWSRLQPSGARVPQAVAVVRRAMTTPRSSPPSYLIVTRSQLAYLETFSNVRPRLLELLFARLRRAPEFRTLYANRDAFVLELRTVESA